MAFIILNNNSIHYKWLHQGKVETLVFINSLGTDFSIWSDVVTNVSRHFNVLLFDKRGHGLSATSEGKITIDDYANDVIALMDALEIKKANIVGLSIGGLITYSLASRYPERLEKLIFSNTGAKIGTTENWNNRIEAIRNVGLKNISNNVIGRWLSEDYQKKYPAEMLGYISMLERNDTIGYIQACEAIRDADYTNSISTIKHKSCFIGGSEDAGTTPEFVTKNAKDLNADLVIINEVGHLPCIEAPEKVAKCIIDFCFRENETILYNQGMATRRLVLGNAHVDKAEANKTEFDADFQEYIINSAWGSIWSRPHLTKRERSLITIAVLATLGHEEELAMHIRATKNTGASEKDIKELLLHIGIYAGVPVSNGAIKIAKKVLNNLKNKNNE